jgi:hypothetical protein
MKTSKGKKKTDDVITFIYKTTAGKRRNGNQKEVFGIPVPTSKYTTKQLEIIGGEYEAIDYVFEMRGCHCHLDVTYASSGITIMTDDLTAHLFTNHLFR